MAAKDMVPDSGPGRGMKQVQAGYGVSEEGRTVVPTATGAQRGAQLGLDHGPRESNLIDGGKAAGVISPAGHPQPPVVVPSAVPALLAEEEGSVPVAPPPAYRPPPVYAPPAQQPPPAYVTVDQQAQLQAQPVVPQIQPPRVSVTIGALDRAELRWRGRFHLVTVNETCVALGFDTRFPWADSPLLPFPHMTPVRVTVIGVKADGTPEPPVVVSVVFMDVTHTSGGVEYSVLPRMRAEYREEPQAEGPRE